ERIAPRPGGIVDLTECRYVIRIELRGTRQCLRQRDARQRILFEGCSRALKQKEQRQHQSPSPGAGTRRPRRARTLWSAKSNRTYATGTMNSVSAVEKKTPPTIAQPRGCSDADRSPP